MRTHSALRAVLLCLLALAPVYGPVKAQSPNNGKPNQFTDGQNGTPNLPIAPSMIVDKNNMREVYSDNQDNFPQPELKKAFVKSFYQAVQAATNDLVQSPPAPEETIRADYTTLRGIIEEEYKTAVRDAAKIQLPNQYLYVGAEARAGSDKPVFGPEATFGDSRSGLELGIAEYFQSAYRDGTSRRDSLGFSLKYIPHSLAASTVTDYGHVQKALLDVERPNLNPSRPTNAVTILSLHDIVKADANPDREPIETIASNIGAISRALDVSPSATIHPLFLPRVNILTIITALDKTLDSGFITLNRAANSNLENFVKGTRKPAVAFVVGDQSFRGGDIFNGGVTASYLHPFGEGAPGVTAVAVLQYLHDSFRETGRRDAGRLGLAAIYQNKTLSLTHPVAPSTVEKLGPPWQYKVGIEYTTPLLGLHETGAVFARYRWTPSYFEVTTTYGKDGLRKDYLDVSVGKSFTF